MSEIPRTADGEPLVPGMNVWVHAEPLQLHVDYITWHEGDQSNISVCLKRGGEVYGFLPTRRLYARKPTPPEPDDEYLLSPEPSDDAFDAAMTSTDPKVIVDALAEVGLPRNVWVGGVAKALASANSRANVAEVTLTRLAELFMDEHGDPQGELDDWVPGDVDEIVAILLPYLPGEKVEETPQRDVVAATRGHSDSAWCLYANETGRLLLRLPDGADGNQQRIMAIADAINTILRELPDSPVARLLEEWVG